MASTARSIPSSPSLSSWHALKPYVHPYRVALLQGVLLLLVTNAFDKAIPWLLQHAVDALTAHEFGRVQQLALGVVGCAAMMALVRVLSRVRIFNVGRQIEFELRNDLMQHLHRLGPSFYQRMPTGEIMSRAINDLGQVRLLVGFGLLNVINTVFAYTAGIGLMVAISPRLTLYALAPYPFLVLAARAFGKATFTRSRASQEALGRLAERVQETLAGIRLVRAYAIEDVQRRQFESANQDALKRNMAMVVLRGLMWPVLMGVSSIATLVVVWKGASMVMSGELTAGQFAAFNAYVGQLMWPTMALGYLFAVVQRGRAAHGRVQEMLEIQPDVHEPAGAREPKRVGDVLVEGLRYAYDGVPVLDDVSFHVAAERSIAVVGKTGSGKSTLAALLPRLLATPPGSVYLDGDDVTELELRPLRRTIGYAQQEPFLFSTTVALNIGFALDDASSPEAMARIREAARQASILEDIEAMPEGFDTIVGERGVQLSGGQKQRIALARALVNDPSVLVLDDPLSAVDAETEATILQALDRAAAGRTLILVTHRVAAAAHARDVVVLDGGRVVEHGTHEELLQAGGLYAAMCERQQLEKELRT